MREFTSPQLVDTSGRRNATDLLAHRVRTAPDHIAFEVRAADAPLTASWRQVTTREFDRGRARTCSAHPAGLGRGTGDGNRHGRRRRRQ